MKYLLVSSALLFSLLYAAEPVQHDVATTKEFLVKQPKAVVLDVRTPEEFAEGHLPGAVLVTLGEKDFVERVKKVSPADQPVLVYCRSGGRSAKAVAELKAAGFSQIHELKGGITAWVDQKQSVTKP